MGQSGLAQRMTTADCIAMHMMNDVSVLLHIVFLKFVKTPLYSPAVSYARSFINKLKSASSFHQHLPFLRDLCRSCFIRPNLSVDLHETNCRSLKTQRHRHKQKHNRLPLSHSVTLSVLQDATGSMILGHEFKSPKWIRAKNNSSCCLSGWHTFPQVKLRSQPIVLCAHCACLRLLSWAGS